MAMRAEGEIALRDLLDAFGERSFGAAILLLAAPNIIPLPPGSSTVFGVPLIFVTLQLMLGWKAVWLPEKIMGYRLKAETFRYIVEKLVPWLEKVEKLLKPRGTLLVSPMGERLAGLACLALSLILSLPIWGANIVPAMALSAFALGLIEQDAHAMAAGWLLTLATAAILAAVGGLAIAAAFAFLAWI